MDIKFFGKKSKFLILTFLNLILQTVITRVTMVKSEKEKRSGWFRLGLFILQIGLIIAMIMPIPVMLKFLLFCIFSITSGLMLSSLNLNEEMLHIAFYGSISIFGLMSFIGVLLSVFNINIGPRVGLTLFYSLLGLILFGLFNIITGNSMYKLYSMIGIVLFSIFIIYDTNKIIQRNYNGDFIQSSLDYYLDILNLFLDINLLNSR